MAMIANYGGHATADQALDEVVNRLVEALDPVAICLFGSRAHRAARPEDGEAGWDWASAYAPLVGRGMACDVLPVPVAGRPVAATAGCRNGHRRYRRRGGIPCRGQGIAWQERLTPTRIVVDRRPTAMVKSRP